jgi:hypothetical protein
VADRRHRAGAEPAVEALLRFDDRLGPATSRLRWAALRSAIARDRRDRRVDVVELVERGVGVAHNVMSITNRPALAPAMRRGNQGGREQRPPRSR